MHDLITTALLLAAGAGTRLQPLTNDCPKCLTELHGIPILKRLVSCLVEEGFRRLVVVVGYRDMQIRDYLERHSSGLVIDFVDCREYATTNNIYSLWLAREHVREPFVLIESDLVFDSHLLGQMRVRDRIAVARCQSPLLGTTVSINDFGRVLSFRVGANPSAASLGYKTVNMYSLSTKTWCEVVRRLDRHIAAGKVQDYYEVVFAEMVADGILAFQSVRFDEGRWCEIDTLEDLRAAEQIFRMSTWTVELERGVWLATWEGDPGRTLVKDSAKRFASCNKADAALVAAREYRPFAQATVSDDSA